MEKSLKSLRHVTEMSVNLIDIKTSVAKEINFFRNENKLWTCSGSDIEFTDEHFIKIISCINNLNDEITYKGVNLNYSGTSSVSFATNVTSSFTK